MGRREYAQSYIDRVKRIYDRDDARYQYRATDAVVRFLARVMAYKDEIYAAHLLTSEEKHRRDRARYDVDPSRGDRISYRHLTRPHFTVLGLDIKFDLQTRDWMLNIMKRARFFKAIPSLAPRRKKLSRLVYRPSR